METNGVLVTNMIDGTTSFLQHGSWARVVMLLGITQGPLYQVCVNQEEPVWTARAIKNPHCICEEDSTRWVTIVIACRLSAIIMLSRLTL